MLMCSTVYCCNPPPQVLGASNGQDKDPVAQMQKQVAANAVRQTANSAASSARSGIHEITAYIQENPASVKVACFLVGLVLILFSILGCLNLFGAAFKPKEYLTNVYNVFFGIIICICDGKESWMNSCWDVQNKLFQYAYVLASQTGRAIFYFYVGSMTLLVLPDNAFWDVVYVCIGAALCLLALLMLILDWCGKFCGCNSDNQRAFDNMASSRDPRNSTATA